MDIPDTWSELLLRPLVAVACAGLLGLDREVRGKPAGLRTHMLVALGSAAFTIATLRMFDQMQSAGSRWTGVDPIRVISGIVGGIGFLGAGAILHSRGSIRGITTAAAIWVAGALGVACGAGYFREAAIIAGYALMILVVFGWIEGKLHGGDEPHRDLTGDEDVRPAPHPANPQAPRRPIPPE